jgi:hypothetical protein
MKRFAFLCVGLALVASADRARARNAEAEQPLLTSGPVLGGDRVFWGEATTDEMSLVFRSPGAGPRVVYPKRSTLVGSGCRQTRSLPRAPPSRSRAILDRYSRRLRLSGGRLLYEHPLTTKTSELVLSDFRGRRRRLAFFQPGDRLYGDLDMTAEKVA